jgi:TonB family protein
LQAVNVLEGGNPFSAIVLSTLRRWRFLPARITTSIPPESYITTPVASEVSAVFLFRSPFIFSWQNYQPVRPNSATPDRPVVPLRLSDPGYPPRSVAQGTVVLELRISTSGHVENVRVVADGGGLGGWTEKTVRTWQFAPALREGVAVRGTVLVAVSYLRPVI